MTAKFRFLNDDSVLDGVSPIGDSAFSPRTRYLAGSLEGRVGPIKFSHPFSCSFYYTSLQFWKGYRAKFLIKSPNGSINTDTVLTNGCRAIANHSGGPLQNNEFIACFDNIKFSPDGSLRCVHMIIILKGDYRLPPIPPMHIELELYNSTPVWADGSLYEAKEHIQSNKDLDIEVDWISLEEGEDPPIFIVKAGGPIFSETIELSVDRGGWGGSGRGKDGGWVSSG
ncbi:hypothetical protein [Caulobacter sp.]|uniref:hypothetical protein n=1 Tax=Caulobacter sp. TaxID=78 RepID=UPI003BACD449